jgi:predicted acylesterase/phospholipase RssA
MASLVQRDNRRPPANEFAECPYVRTAGLLRAATGDGLAAWRHADQLLRYEWVEDTLKRLVDFDRINAREIRFSVSAVNVRTGNFAYFDNAQMTIRPEHVMTSAALPPCFPAVEIDGECYWDGGLVSNTPPQYVLGCIPRRSRLTFQVDLFQPAGASQRILRKSASARRTSAIPAGPAPSPICFARCTTSATTSTASGINCPRTSGVLRKRNSSIA